MALPPLGPDARVRVSRQGGFAAVPGLSRPREIDLAQCDSAQRGRICSLLERCLPVASDQAGKGDQRFFRIELQPHAADRDAFVMQIPEPAAPGELVCLWSEGRVE